MEWLLHNRLAHFNCQDFGLETQDFTTHVLALLQDASWDRYDVRRRRLDFLLSACPEHHAAVMSIYREYYLGGDTRLLQPFTDHLSAEQIQAFYQIIPFRKRSHARFSLRYQHGQWHCTREKGRVTFMQGDGEDLRALPRIFQPMPETVDHNAYLKRFLCFAADTVRTRHPDSTTLNIDMHFMALHLHGEHAASNAPEGVHQDGSDYIVSALVLARENVTGGTSLIYEANDKMTPIHEHTLEVGQGILQEDQHSSLWHTVSAVHPIDPTHDATRAILGLDINFLK